MDRLVPGAVLRTSAVQVEFAGKGVNLARTLTANGHPAKAVICANNRQVAEHIAALHQSGVTTHIVPTDGPLRTNLTIIETDGTTTKINESGPSLRQSVQEALLDAAVTHGKGAQWLVANGSLPPNTPADFYVQLAKRLPRPANQLVIDTSGEALKKMVGVACAIAKPNLNELASLVEAKLETVSDVVDAANQLRRHECGWGTVLVSLGAGGAVLVGERVFFGTSEACDIKNTVGAGDALLAGFLAAGARGSTALHTALAWARAAVRSANTVAPPSGKEDLAATKVTDEVPFSMPVGHLLG